jgi:hypothetical protein
VVHVLLGYGTINTHSLQQKKVFSVGSMPRRFLEDNRRYSQSIEMRVQVWRVNQRTTEESPVGMTRCQKTSSEDMAVWRVVTE